MTSLTADRKTFYLPEPTVQFIEKSLSDSETHLNQISLTLTNKNKDLHTLLAKIEAQMQQTSIDLRSSFSKVSCANNSRVDSLQQSGKKLEIIEKKINQAQLLTEDDKIFNQDVLAYEMHLTNEMEALNTFAQTQSHSLEKKLQKLELFFNPIRKSLEDYEKKLLENDSNLTQKLSEFSTNCTQDIELTKQQSLKLKERLQQIATQEEFLQKTLNLTKPPEKATTEQTPPEEAPPEALKKAPISTKKEEVLDKLLSCKIDLQKAETQFSSLFENAFQNKGLTKFQKNALKLSLELMESNHPGAKDTVHAQKISTNLNMNQDLLEVAIVDALTNDSSDYYFTECSGPGLQTTEKPLEQLLTEIQKAVIRSFLEEHSALLPKSSLSPDFLNQAQYPSTLKNYLHKSKQMDKLILVINKKTQVGIRFKMDEKV